mmetsp:Transcript_9609/g.17322  ORF Transcript_9609/g.17322 Transcript_9609/m.17322 type:complete len:315 (-) Transcript_9609:1276-2220(-)
MNLQSGWSVLEVENIRGNSLATKLFSTYPSKLISLTPHSISSNSNAQNTRISTTFYTQFGGGIVSGDSYKLLITIHSNAQSLITTQGATKVYKSTKTCQHPTQSRIHAFIKSNSVLLFMPDTVILYKDAAFQQSHEFHLEDESSSLLLVDSLSRGRRTNSNEEWNFKAFQNEILIGYGTQNESVLIKDCVDLNGIRMNELMHCMNSVITVYVLGPVFKQYESELMEKYLEIQMESRNNRHSRLYISKSSIVRINGRRNVRNNACCALVFRIVSSDAVRSSHALHTLLSPFLSPPQQNPQCPPLLPFYPYHHHQH